MSPDGEDMKSMASKIPEREIMMPRDGDTRTDLRFLAQLYGYRFYRTRIACRNGHRSPRRASTGECVACTADRWRRWRDRHPEAARATLEGLLTARLTAKGPSASGARPERGLKPSDKGVMPSTG